MIAFDIETQWDYKTKTGDGSITQIALADANGVEVSSDWKTLAQRLVGAEVVGHNSWSFDVPRLRSGGIQVPFGADTMVLAYLLDETQPLGLEALCIKYLGVGPWKNEGHSATQGSADFDLYNSRDAEYTLRLYEALIAELGQSRLGVSRAKIATSIILPGKLALDECSRRGNFINLRAVRVAEKAMRVQKSEAYGILQTQTFAMREQLLPEYAWELEMKPEDFNPNAGAQVAQYLISQGIGLPKTKKGALRTSVGVLEDHKELPFVSALLLYRKAAKQLSTYIEGYKAAALSGDGRVHPEYTVCRTVVGRTSCKNPNVQNIIRDLKPVIKAPPGKLLVTADYKTLHIVLFAWVAQEKSMLRYYKENPAWDPHTFFASRLYKVSEAQITTEHKADPNNSKRQVAKSANFGLLYMGDGWTLKNYCHERGMELSMDRCNLIHHEWHSTFPGAKEFYDITEERLLRLGYVETATGRRRHLGTPEELEQWRRSKGNKWKYSAALREAVNFMVLGFEPDIALLGLSACHQAGLPISRFVHDSIELEVEAGIDRKAFEEVLRYCMCEYPVAVLNNVFKIGFDSPLVIDVEYK
jgi:DNA polymerase I-like protein with 3'-5' exonuclease and polymerase domains